METENNSKKIKVYCYDHQTACEVNHKPQIVCAIEEHTLSNDFPNAEFWEYCCDCQTFLPTKPEVTGKATAGCPSCDRRAERRFVCQNCKVASFESDEPARGKIYGLQSSSGIEPNCPGCQFSANQEVLTHQCNTLKTTLFTARETCPFCLEKTKPNDKNAQPSAVAATVENDGLCPQCSAQNPPNTIFCGKCRYQLRKEVAVSNLGNDVNKTQLLGSLCPTCGTPVPPDSDFCGECGQAVKKAIPPPPPPPPRTNAVNFPQNSEQSVPAVSFASNNNLRNIFIGVGAVIAFFVLVGFISSISKSSSVSTSNSSGSVKSDTNNFAKTASNRYNTTSQTYKPAVSNTPNDSTSDSRIGKTGTINMDCNLRESASKDSSWVGTHYRGASIRILDVVTVPGTYGGTTDWFKIEVISYGNSMDPAKYGQYGKDDGSEDVGWVNSYPEVYEGNRKVRRPLVSLK